MQTLILVFVALISLGATTDYCSKSLSCSDRKNIACGHSGKFNSSCPADAAMVKINDNQKSLIVDMHNSKRNLIASGGVAKHDAACRMATIQWDNELASLAELNVKQCVMNHDHCHKTDRFKHSGQNLGWITYYDKPNTTGAMETLMNAWYNEVQLTNMTIINSYPKEHPGLKFGHFTVMVVDRNIRVGCAASTYNSKKIDNYFYFLFACNYATNNIVKYRVYESCSKAGSSCTTGPNPQYPNLCSTAEVYDL